MKLSHCLATGLLGAIVACSNAEAPANTPESFTASTLSSEAETGRLAAILVYACLLYTSPSPRDQRGSRMPSSA